MIHTKNRYSSKQINQTWILSWLAAILTKQNTTNPTDCTLQDRPSISLSKFQCILGLKLKYALDLCFFYAVICVIKSLNMCTLFWKTTHPEYSLPLSPPLLSWAYQTPYQAFHKPAYIIQAKKLTTHIHRHHNKWPTRLNYISLLSPDSKFSSSSCYSPSKQSIHVYPFSKGPIFIDSYSVYHGHSQNSYFFQHPHQTSVILVLSILFRSVSCSQHPMQEHRSKSQWFWLQA